MIDLAPSHPKLLVFGQQFPHILDLAPSHSQLLFYGQQFPHLIDLAFSFFEESILTQLSFIGLLGLD